mgnify:CR=1 FL=1
MLYDINEVVAIVITYNPKKEMLENFKTYLDSVSILYIVDNSDDIVNREWIFEFCKKNRAIYISNCGNKGIAYSLNYIINIINNKWLLTMDQDSSFLNGKATEFIHQALYHNRLDSKDNIFAYSAHNVPEYAKPSGLWYEDKYAITSGCLLNTRKAKEVGLFDEALFIDEVDFEFCWRCRKIGYKVLKYNKNIIKHTIGEVSANRFFAKKMNFENSFRYEYIFRNIFYEVNKHPDMIVDRGCYLVKVLLKNMIFNNRRFDVLKALVKGIELFIFNSMGKIRKDVDMSR